MPDTPLNPDALEAMSRAMNPPAWSVIERYPEDELVIMTKEAELSKAEKLARAYVAVAQPAVNRAEELDALPVGSVIADLYDDRGDAPVVLCKALNRDWAALTTGTQNGRQWWTSAEIAHVARRLRVLHRPEVDA